MLCLVLLPLFCGGQVLGTPDDLKSLKAIFSQGKLTREGYLDQLVTLRYKDVSSGEYKEVSAIDEEMEKHPLPPNSDSKLLSRLRVGEWESPHHSYLYRSDYSWTMLPIEDDVTHGLWEIEGNKYYDWVPIYSPKRYNFIIILLDEHYFVFTDGKYFFCEKRVH
jgi:hypothetical protein